MFNMRIDYEMIASSGAPQWQYTSGLLKYTLERGLTSELYQELIAINPYFVEVLEPIVKSGG